MGLDICGTEHGKALGQGLFEFRIRHDEDVILGRAKSDAKRKGSEQVLLRIFCHAYGQRVVLLLGGYDKGSDASKRRQDREIERARARLRSFKLMLKRKEAGNRRRR